MHTPETTPTPPQVTATSQAAGAAANRRSFLKGTAFVAGVAAAGALTTAAQAAPIAASTLKVEPRAVLHVGFDMRTQPTLKDVYRSLEEVLNLVGCPNCGLAGLEVRFGLDQVLPLHSEVPATATLEGGLLQGF